MLECTCTVPLGVPVEPEEYSQKQASSRVVGAGANSSLPFARRSRNAMWPLASLPETTTCSRNGSLPSSGSNCGSSASDTNSTRARLSLSMNS